jgi:hypothetical protein
MGESYGHDEFAAFQPVADALAGIPTNHGPVTTCDSVPCALPCDGSVVTRAHALPSQSEFSDIIIDLSSIFIRRRYGRLRDSSLSSRVRLRTRRIIDTLGYRP